MSPRRTLLGAALVFLAACGSGGDSSTEPSPGSPTTPGTTTTPGTPTTPTTPTPSECPLFDGTACAPFLDGCWAPDLAGTCTDNGLRLDWSDGHSIQRTGGGAGLYGPTDGTPCITLDFDLGTLTSTLTNVATGETLKNRDLGDGTIEITCTDDSVHVFTAAELGADNVCKGIACP